MSKRSGKAAGKRVPRGANQAPAPKAAGHAPVKGQLPQEETEQLRARLTEAEETLRAIREGEVDAIVVTGSGGDRIFSLTGTEQVYRLIVETMREAAVTLTFDGTILFANAQFGQFVKRPMDRIRGHPLTEFVAPDHRAAVASLLNNSQTQPVKTRLVLQDSDGMCVPAHVSSSILDQPDGTSICIVATNLTDLENSTELIQQLRRQQEALREADRHKDDFLALLGHELRSPLSPIANAVDLLRNMGPADERQQRVHDIIDRQLTHLVHLVDDLLDVSRISHGKILLRKGVFDLVAEVGAVVEDHRPLLESNGLRLDLALPPSPLPIEGDRARIAQIVANLLTNAGKFTPTGGRVSVELAADADGKARITVSDTGVGLEPELLSCIFQPFYQGARSLDAPRNGLGLGLALVQALIEMHGGTVHVNSAGLGKGAQFIVTFPTQTQRPVIPEKPTPVPKVAALSPRRVLVIEDNRMAVEGLQMLLELDGHTVAISRTGSDGLEKAKTFKPELVISDIDLGGSLDGRAVARALRQEPEVAEAYMVAYSGFGQEQDKRKSLDAGFDVHLTKPIRIDDLRRVVTQLPSTANARSGHASVEGTIVAR